MGKKKLFFTKRNLHTNQNLWLGNMGDVITDETILATYFINLGSIVNFEIEGNDVYAYITGTQVETVSEAFNGSQLTYIKSTILYRTNVRSFANCSNLEYLELPSLQNVVTEMCINSRNINFDKCNFDSLITLGQSMFEGSDNAIGTLNLPACTTVGIDAFKYTSVNITVNLPLVTFLGGATLRQVRGHFYMPSLKNMGATCAREFITSLIYATAVLTVPIAMATQCGGVPDEDITYATDRGATVIYI